MQREAGRRRRRRPRPVPACTWPLGIGPALFAPGQVHAILTWLGDVDGEELPKIGGLAEALHRHVRGESYLPSWQPGWRRHTERVQGLRRTNAEAVLRRRGRVETLHAGEHCLIVIVTELGHGTQVRVYLD